MTGARGCRFFLQVSEPNVKKSGGSWRFSPESGSTGARNPAGSQDSIAEVDTCP